ncbi:MULTISPECIES: biopolymer transporter ExbD [unclassified Leeuwenhoekiella]|uniref:ExbD/TolR family protein n=1 Tax=unclassified Leeuwenhoekiella TaxID=2615029 RepID=UPI000C40D40E|nr:MULTISPECIES: biopolymer transporter ExbD [unclassified Leeuwenhoekiella]MAW93607.1 biopolymer transporter ExbD [Leeuwenhoekiella sp.]MAW96331.1 biopolymer transporter ExbD [Leeuwenhoekiella sp.]MBA82822.1 biopolymer transporter ExbD [Leeuwenhoekiella sp.]|tara:strand:- start:14731 stop:15336 length:606 start_codon:yes stop_codon:yes gene_type:complete
MAKRAAPEVNAGSMADIAFLLLIFFLVTTTIETDSGISRKLPPELDENQPPPPVIKERNLFTVIVNSNDELLVEDEVMQLKDLRAAAVAFLDNGAEDCSYCQGAKAENSSTNPTKAIISLVNNRGTSYKRYIAVQNELVAAYNELRDREAQSRFGESFVSMEQRYNDPRTSDRDKERLKPRIEEIRELYPEKLSEAEPQKG